MVSLLELRGLALGCPHSSQVKGSKHGHMRELRRTGRPFRIFYASNPQRHRGCLFGSFASSSRCAS